MKKLGFIGLYFLGVLVLTTTLGAAQGNNANDIGQITRSLERQTAVLDKVLVRYRIEVTQEMPADEIEAKVAEDRQRLGSQASALPGHVGPLPVLIDCIWAKTNGVEYLETIQHHVEGQVLLEKRLVSTEKTIRWQAPDNVWDPRLKGDFAKVLVTTNRGAGWVQGYRFARFYAEDEQGKPLAESFKSADWIPAGLDTADGKRIHRLKRTSTSSSDSYTVIGFDENRGFAPISRTIVEGGKTNFDWTVEDSREVAPGVWLPLRITKQRFWRATEQPLDVARITVIDIKVNEKVPANALELQWDRGSLILDEIKGVKYREGLTAPEPIGN